MRLLFVCFMMTTLPAFSQDRSQARSMVVSGYGIVATSQTLASQAGADVLARGGSAIDAAIAANAVLGVVEPMMNGIGGDLFAIHWEKKTGKVTGINASGWAAKAQSLEYMKAKGLTTMPPNGIQTVTVPGCVEGWEKLHKRFGKLPLREVLQPAIWFAVNGFPVTELIQRQWESTTYRLADDENAKKVYGLAPELGGVTNNPGLANAYRLIAAGGAAAFYKGPIAKAIVKTSKRLGGPLALADFAEYQAEFVDPISTEYRGWRVYEMPPSGQGIAALEMLNIMERFSMTADPVLALHRKIEAQKLAYADLHQYVADTRFAKVPTRVMMSKEYAAGRAKLIDPAKASCQSTAGEIPSTGDTVYLSVVDREGNIVSLIQSVSALWGSGIVADDFGILLHNRGAMFRLEAAHPNVIAGRKRPFHTIIPAFMERGDVHIGFGIMGGLNQAQAHAQFVSNLVDGGMNIQAALEAPRFTKPLPGGCDLEIEARVPVSVREGLEKLGHRLQVVGDFSSDMGGGQAVLHDAKTGINYGASSPRRDGAAVPESAPYFRGMGKR